MRGSEVKFWDMRSILRAIRCHRSLDGLSGPDLVEKAAPELARLSREVVPLVIFVEDVHLADANLIDLLQLHPQVWQVTNQLRAKFGLNPLKWSQG